MDAWILVTEKIIHFELTMESAINTSLFIASIKPAYCAIPNIKVHGANMWPIWDRQAPGGPHVGPMNLTIWGMFLHVSTTVCDKQ